MKKICILGNCQSERVAFIMGLKCPSLEIIKLKSVHLITDADRIEVESKLDSADIILSQPINDTFRLNWLSGKYIKERYEGKLITFSNFYFTGYDPSFCYINHNGSRLTGPLDGGHFKPIIESYLSGETKDMALEKWHNLENEYLNIANMSLKELISRDEKCDIKLSSIFLEKFRLSKLMNTMNHPTFFMHDIAVDYILNYLSIIVQEKLSFHSASSWLMLSEISVACNPSVRDKLEISYADDTIYSGYNMTDGVMSSPRYFNASELVAAFYEHYDWCKCRFGNQFVENIVLF